MRKENNFEIKQVRFDFYQNDWDRILNYAKDQNPEVLSGVKITSKEKQIIKYIIIGYTDKQISEHMCRSIFTIKTHVKNILGKLNITSRHKIIYSIIKIEKLKIINA